MIREFAVEPEALATWAELKYVTEKFGVEQGRFISRFPDEWASIVKLNMRESSWRRRQQFIARLRDLDKGREGALLESWRDFKAEKPWTKNAARSHKKRPFHAVISAEPCRDIGCATAIDDAEEKHFRVDRERAVRRTASVLASTVAPLLHRSSEILFIDPHFDPTEPRFRLTLGTFLGVATANGRKLERCEFHMKSHWKKGGNPHPLKQFPIFQKACLELLPDLVPVGVALKLVRWRQLDRRPRSATEHIHPRYILTNLGGLRVESGLDEGRGNETTDVSLLTEKLRRKRWEDFLGNPPAYAPADVDSNGNHRCVTVTGTRAR